MELEEPIELPLARNCTLVIVPSASEAFAVIEVATPTPTVAPAAGLVIATVGDWLVATVTETAELVAWLPAVSVAIAVSEIVPLAFGDQIAV